MLHACGVVPADVSTFPRAGSHRRHPFIFLLLPASPRGRTGAIRSFFACTSSRGTHRRHPFISPSEATHERTRPSPDTIQTKHKMRLSAAASSFLLAFSASRASAFAPATTMASRAAASSLSVSKGDTIEFAKYEGLGNDFILIDDRDKSAPSLTPEQSERLCDRNFGIGGDGVIFALKPDAIEGSPEVEGGYDFTMRIYNSDGSEPEMCGNGIRCFAAFLRDLGADAPSYNVNTLAGPIVPVMNDDAEKTITVDMGPPILDGPTVPTTLEPNADDNSVVEQTLECNGKEWKVSAVSMGNPHAIIFVDDLEKDIDFEVDGPALESHPAFPAKTNVEFVQVLSPTHLKMKVWERGAGPTLACGTGTCALVVAAIRANKIPRPADGEQVRVTLPGGDLLIEWREDNNKVYMSGPGTFSFKGQAILK